jgi:hypothetical protein
MLKCCVLPNQLPYLIALLLKTQENSTKYRQQMHADRSSLKINKNDYQSSLKSQNITLLDSSSGIIPNICMYSSVDEIVSGLSENR